MNWRSCMLSEGHLSRGSVHDSLLKVTQPNLVLGTSQLSNFPLYGVFCCFHVNGFTYPPWFYGGFASRFIPWPWEFLKHILNSSLDCTLIWIAEHVLGDFVFSMAGRSVHGMLYTFIKRSIYKECDRLDWTRPSGASTRKKGVTLSYLYYSTNHVLLDNVN